MELVAESIRCGGLAEIKAKRIQSILRSVYEERGSCSLEHLRTMSDAKIKKYLSQFKGVGPKTISCVLMFCLGRQDFPVDTHVWKMAINLGWVPGRSLYHSLSLLSLPIDRSYLIVFVFWGS